MADSKENDKFYLGVKGLNLYTLASACIYSINFLNTFLMLLTVEFVKRSRTS